MHIELPKGILSKIGSLSIRSYLKALPYALLIGLVTTYCILPTLLNNYTWIPGDDHTEYLLHLKDFPQPIRYYGALPAKLLPFEDPTSLRIYYYSTPLLVLIGLLISFKGYSFWTPTLAFLYLFFITPVVLQDMEAGTFVGIVAFYLIFIPSLFYICKSTSNKYLITFLLLFTSLFHTTVGTFLMLAYLFQIRKPKDILPLIPGSIVAIIWGVFFDGSTSQVLQATNYTYTPPMELVLFLKHYLGISTFVIVSLGFLFCYNTSKFYVYRDRTVLTIIVLIVIFLLLAFLPFFHLNSDRLSKFAVGLIIIVTCLTVTKAFSRLEASKMVLYLLLGGILAATGFILLNTFQDQLTFWISLGV